MTTVKKFLTARISYVPTDQADWEATWDMLCRHCAFWLNCSICEAMIEHRSGEPWPEGGWVTDPGAGTTCLSYQPRATQAKLSRQVLRRIERNGLPPVCDGCAARKGTDASQSLHTMRDFQAAVRERREFLCHENGGLCGGALRAMLNKRRPT